MLLIMVGANSSEARTAPMSAEQVLIDGDLRNISLTSLLQLAQAEAISGWIRVVGRGEITLLKGHVGHATCGPLSGVEALRELAFHDRGRFTLGRGEPGGERCADNVTFALVDAYRLRDEWARLSGTVLRRVGERPWMPTSGSLDRVVPNLDGRRTLAAVMHDQPWLYTLVLDAVLDALHLGLLERVPTGPAREEPAAADDDDPDELAARGRALLHHGQLDEAEALLRRALAARPDDRAIQQNLRALARRRAAAPP